MEYRYLGRSGLKVSTICLGTMTFSHSEGILPTQCDEETSHAILDRFVALGGNFIDTANVYSQGKSEEVIGSWLKKNHAVRKRLVIASKVRFPMDPTEPNAMGLSRKHILASVEDTLQRLGTSYIDILQMHCWDEGTPIEETLRTVAQLIQQGKVLYFGVSNVLGWQLQKIVDVSRELNLPPIVSLQAQYSLLCRWTEWELQAVCQNEGLGLLPWSPLKGGWLSGKFRRDDKSPVAGTRVAWAEETGSKLQSAPGFSAYASDEKIWELIDTLHAIAEETQHTVAQVALRWLLQKAAVPSVVIGAKTVQQLEDNIKAGFSGFRLSSEQMARLDTLSEVPVPYPYEMVWRCQAPRKR